MAGPSPSDVGGGAGTHGMFAVAARATPGSHMTYIDGAWRSIHARPGFHDVRIHETRHSFGSRVLWLGGGGLPIIGRLLGHRRAERTARYTHLDRDAVRTSAQPRRSSDRVDRIIVRSLA